MTAHPPPPPDDARYLAVVAKDARFDGCFFTGVTSTGIYCRPVCRVRTPKRENCRFFHHAAQAEQAGFRPCLRCRPELAPHTPLWTPTPGQALDSPAWSMQDASRILAAQAAQLLDHPHTWCETPPSVRQLARRLGVSDRHVRRIFEAHLGVSPLQYLQTQRLLCAKQLLTDTPLSVTEVAALSGFASLRRFNAAFAAHYALNPTQLRRQGPPRAGAVARQGIHVKLAYRPPYDVDAMLQFFATRQIPGVEDVALHATPAHPHQSLRRTLSIRSGQTLHTGWLEARFSAAPNAVGRVDLYISESLRQVLPQVMARVRALLDLDAEPQAINAVLHADFPTGDGLRVPGTLDGFELAVRAVLGQQITVAAARTLAVRLVERFGTPVDTPFASLTRLFPSPEALAGASGDALGQLGIVKQRQAAIVALAQAVTHQGLSLHPGADLPSTLAALQALPGVGDWTAQYIAMRALRWPDAFPSGDVALHKALGVQDSKQPAKAAQTASRAWQPWRSYAVLRAWARLPAKASAAAPAAPTFAIK